VETTSLYRAVTPAELCDLTRQAGVFRNPPGVEVKYFSETAEGAASYAQHTFGTGLYEGPYTIVSTEIASPLITLLCDLLLIVAYRQWLSQQTYCRG